MNIITDYDIMLLVCMRREEVIAYAVGESTISVGLSINLRCNRAFMKSRGLTGKE